MRKIKISESNLYNIIKQVLIEQEQEKEKKVIEFSSEQFKLFILTKNHDKFVNALNANYDKVVIDGGSLDLDETEITILPDNLVVSSSLYLNYCKNIKYLPNNLKVLGNLGLFGTTIKSLPNDIQISDSLFLNKTPIEYLPNNLKVKDTLVLTDCKKLKSLPNNLRLRGDLFLTNTQITSLPDDLVVRGEIFIHGTPLNNNDKLVKEYEEKEYVIIRR